jgi:antitoxin PrlF
LATATLTSKGQITMPQEVRQALGLHTGDKVDFVPDDVQQNSWDTIRT